jgi:RNA polymerase sigma factor (sigma-70 family)
VSTTAAQSFLDKIQPHKGIIYKIARMYADTPEDREDLVQEIMLRLWASYPGFEGRSAFSTWMYRVAVNTAITFLRKDKKKPPMVSDENGILDREADETDTGSEYRMTLFYKAIKELNQIEKALIFYFMEGLSHREISGHLGLSETNTRVKLSRTKEKIQKIIKSYGYEF